LSVLLGLVEGLEEEVGGKMDVLDEKGGLFLILIQLLRWEDEVGPRRRKRKRLALEQ